MTVETLHDAIGLLPADLILETDKKRSRPVKTLPWKRIAAMAACIALILFCGTLFRSGLAMGGSTKSAAMESMVEAEAPAAAAQMEESALTCETMAAAPREENAADESPAEAAGSSLCIDHAHPAESTETRNENGAYCGLTTATLYIDGEAHTLTGSDAIALTDILRHLDYSADNLCRCMAEYTADTETETGYEINLTEYFVRHGDTQAALTIEQAETIQALIDALKE